MSERSTAMGVDHTFSDHARCRVLCSPPPPPPVPVNLVIMPALFTPPLAFGSPAALAGTTFVDSNSNGVQDGGETPYEGAQVRTLGGYSYEGAQVRALGGYSPWIVSWNSHDAGLVVFDSTNYCEIMLLCG